ncbi:MAG TPA: response regulator [Clostridiaceae bacterium]|nr:response regulator [Clostridiaceae bacterium]
MMMYRLLLIDDEPEIVEWLEQLFKENERHDFEVFKAYTATSALNIMENVRIDIVVSDICMPGMDGLEITKRIRSRWPKCKVIMLTGYDNFDYIHTALKNDVVSYVLKTEEDEVLINAVEKAISLIERDLEILEINEKSKQLMKRMQPVLQKECINNLLDGRFFSEEKFQAQFNELEIKLRTDVPVLLMVGHMMGLTNDNTYIERLDSFFSINHVVQQYFQSHLHSAFSTMGRGYLFWVMQPLDIQEYTSTIAFIKGSLELIQSSLRKSLRISSSFALSNKPVPWKEVGDKLIHLKHILEKRLGNRSEILVTDAFEGNEGKKYKLPDDEIVFLLRLKTAKIKALERYLENGQEEDFFSLFNEIASVMERIDSMHCTQAMEIYYSLSLMLLSYINRYELVEKIAFKTATYKLMRTDEHYSWKEAMEYLKNFVAIVFEERKSDINANDSDIIAKIKRYVDEHVTEDISLTELSDLVGLNPSYLSRLFKSETGYNLSNYISETKINKARELLKSSEMKVTEISDYLGYSSLSYFSHLFKKATKMTPNEYKQLAKGGCK